MAFNSNDIFQITSTIWEATLGRPIEHESPSPAGPRPPSMCACIQIAGAWTGAIMLDCPVEVARIAAAAMFNTEATNTTVQDHQDALAELVNMLGGNIKALLPEPCFLSLPSVVHGGNYSSKMPGSKQVHHFGFAYAGYPISIQFFEKCPQKAVA